MLDSNAEKVLHIDFPPRYTASVSGPTLSVPTTAPGELGDASAGLAAAKRERIPPPKKAFDFLPDLMEKSEPDFKPREGLKPVSTHSLFITGLHSSVYRSFPATRPPA